jgi:hypothetical protein
MGAVQPAPSFNTIVSFVTNTNGQNYGVEETMSYFGKAGESAASNLGPHSEVGGVCTRRIILENVWSPVCGTELHYLKVYGAFGNERGAVAGPVPRSRKLRANERHIGAPLGAR